MTLDLSAVREQFRAYSGVPAQAIYSQSVLSKDSEGNYAVYPMLLSADEVSFEEGSLVDTDVVSLSHDDEDLLWESATHRLERVALAGRIHVKGYTRRSSAGNVTHVDSYTRSPGTMSVKELDNAIVAMLQEGSLLNPQGRNRLQALRNERRSRTRPDFGSKRVPAPNSRGVYPSADAANEAMKGTPIGLPHLTQQQRDDYYSDIDNPYDDASPEEKLRRYTGEGNQPRFPAVASVAERLGRDGGATPVASQGWSSRMSPAQNAAIVADSKARTVRNPDDYPVTRALLESERIDAMKGPNWDDPDPLVRLRSSASNGEVSATSVAEFIKANPQYSFLDVLRLLREDGLRIRGWVEAPTALSQAHVDRLVALSRQVTGLPLTEEQEALVHEEPTEESLAKQQVLALAAAETEDPEMIALAGRVRVESYKRTSKSGKAVDVEAHFRSPQSMKPEELVEALKALRTAPSTTPLENNRNRNQRRAIVSEMRRRGVKPPTAPDLPGKNGRLKQPDVETARKKVEGGAHPEVAVNELAEKASMDPKEKQAVRKALPKAKDDMDVLGPFAYAHPEGEKNADPEGDAPPNRAGFKAQQDAKKQAEADAKPGSDAWKAKQEARGAKAEETLAKVRARDPEAQKWGLNAEQEAEAKKPKPENPNEAVIRSEPGSDEAMQAIVKADKGSPTGAGTREDPIDVQGDLDKAVQLLAEGKHIRLNKVDEVGTLLDKLTEMVNLAKEKGDEAPVFDLCKVSAPGTNLFCQESKGIPRAKMPQFSGSEIVPGSDADKLPRNHKGEVNIEQQFREELERLGVSITAKTVQAQHLKASQIELDGPKVAGMTKAMEAGKIPDAPIFVTRDGYVIDGHHRWAAKVSLDAIDGELGSITMPVEELDMEIGAALAFANEFALKMGIKPKGLGAAAEGVTKLSHEGLNPAIERLIALSQGR